MIYFLRDFYGGKTQTPHITNPPPFPCSLFLWPSTSWPFGGPVSRAPTKPTPSIATIFFGVLAAVAALCGASLGASYFVSKLNSAENQVIVALASPFAWLVHNCYEPLFGLLGMNAPLYNDSDGLAVTVGIVKKLYGGLFLEWIYTFNTQQFSSSNQNAEFAIIGSIALLSGLTLVTSWLIMLFDSIESDKGMLNWVRKALDTGLSFLTAAGSLTGGLLLTAVYTFDVLALFSVGHMVLFNYPWIFKVAGLTVVGISFGYAYWVGLFVKSFAEMNTLGLSLASAMSFNSLLFFALCKGEPGATVHGNCPTPAVWHDNFSIFNWEPSFIIFLAFLRFFTHATSALGLSLSDRIDGGSDFFFKKNVSAIYQVRAAVMDGLDVLLRMMPIWMLACTTGIGSEFVRATDSLWNGEAGVKPFLNLLIVTAFSLFHATLSVAHKFKEYATTLLLDKWPMTLFVVLLLTASYCSFGSDNKDRTPIMPAFKEVMTTYVHHAKSHEGGSGKKAAAPSTSAASPKARSGSAKRK